MIPLIRLDGSEVIVNAELIATVEKTPDTMLTLNHGPPHPGQAERRGCRRTRRRVSAQDLWGRLSSPGRNSRWILEPSAASFSPSA